MIDCLEPAEILSAENTEAERAKYLSPDLSQQIDLRRRMIANRINALGAEITVYSGTHAQNRNNASSLPFCISPELFTLAEKDRETINKSGKAISAYHKAADSLYRSLPPNHRWRKWLDHSKPDFILSACCNLKDSHLFVRPDFILTPHGPIITEIETSSFGLALSVFLNRAYSEHYPDINNDLALQEIVNAVKDRQPVAFLVTDYTRNYYGQFMYLTKLLRDHGIQASVATPDELASNTETIYRSFYLHEALEDPRLERLISMRSSQFIPPAKAHLEEKALMGMIFDPEFEDYFRLFLGKHFDLLREIFPPTYVLDRSSVPAELPLKSWTDIADLPASKRQYVVKPSGFNKDSSWGKGVEFLHKLSKKECRELLEGILASPQTYVIQSFKKGAVFEQEYFDFNIQQMKTMRGRVRITPYFKVTDGSLLTVKATLCPDTDYIHASVNSINTSVV
jgi:hypothetical protein